MALSSLDIKMQATLGITVTNNVTGHSANANTSNLSKLISFVTGANAASAANNLYSSLLSIPGGGTTTIDLTSFTNIFGQAAQSAARIKGVFAHLLSTADDSTNGTACSGVTIGNAGANPSPLFLGAGTHTIVLANGAFVLWGTPVAAGVAVAGGTKNVLVTNNDGSVAAALRLTILTADT